MLFISDNLSHIFSLNNSNATASSIELYDDFLPHSSINNIVLNSFVKLRFVKYYTIIIPPPPIAVNRFISLQLPRSIFRQTYRHDRNGQLFAFLNSLIDDFCVLRQCAPHGNAVIRLLEKVNFFGLALFEYYHRNHPHSSDLRELHCPICPNRQRIDGQTALLPFEHLSRFQNNLID